MKKLLIIGMFLLLFVGCSNTKDDNTSEDSDTYTGSVTSLSEKYLSKGYLINVYRSSVSLGDDLENYGKAYITMTFNVVTEITTTIGYEDTEKHIAKKKISNIRIVKSPKMGIAEEIYPDYFAFGTNTELKGSNNSYTKEFSTPVYFSDQTSIAVTVNHIALYDASNYGWDETPTTSQIYNDLGITRDEVALTLGFRIEYTTVDNKVFFKDYEIEMPAKNYDISGSEFQSNFLTDDTSLMESFLEKD
jgi:hypothetical protein